MVQTREVLANDTTTQGFWTSGKRVALTYLRLWGRGPVSVVKSQQQQLGGRQDFYKIAYCPSESLNQKTAMFPPEPNFHSHMPLFSVVT